MLYKDNWLAESGSHKPTDVTSTFRQANDYHPRRTASLLFGSITLHCLEMKAHVCEQITLLPVDRETNAIQTNSANE